MTLCPCVSKAVVCMLPALVSTPSSRLGVLSIRSKYILTVQCTGVLWSTFWQFEGFCYQLCTVQKGYGVLPISLKVFYQLCMQKSVMEYFLLVWINWVVYKGAVEYFQLVWKFYNYISFFHLQVSIWERLSKPYRISIKDCNKDQRCT